MESSWKRLRRNYIKPLSNRFNRWKSASYGDIRVHFKKHLDGGGRTFGQDLVTFLELHGMPQQQRVFEWCAGPGFIGFSLLFWPLPPPASPFAAPRGIRPPRH